MTTLTQALADLPDLIVELRSRITPGRGGGEGRRAPGYAQHAPVALGTLDAADDLYGSLVEHAACIADELGTRPPRARAWGGTRGIPAHMDDSTTHHQARALARFITHQLPLVTDTSLAFDIESDIVKRHNKYAARYPRTPATEKIDARCPNCGRLDIHQHPPDAPGDDETWKCASCGLHLQETQVLERREARARELRAKKKTRKDAA
jgi:predicted RNA-binding Zn-ribbon protein involved in translation (DUF1610 family)